MTKVACGSERSSVAVAAPFRKEFWHADDPTQWDYYAVGGDDPESGGQQLQVASCTPISPNPARPNGTAICQTVWGTDGLVLTLGFEENELNKLPEMRARTTKLLSSWRVR